MSGFDAGDDKRYQVTVEDARIIRAYQVCRAFHCLDLDVYRRNPHWWNEACAALIHTEAKAQAENSQRA